MKASLKPEEISLLEETTGLKASKVSEMLPQITKSLLLKWHTGVSGKFPAEYNEETNERVEKAWEKLFGYPMGDVSELSDPAPVYLKGIPGQGKTTVIAMATKNIAKAMGVKHHTNPSNATVVDKNDILLTVTTLAGEMSSAKLNGLSFVEDGVSKVAPTLNMVRTVESNFACAMYDDITTAGAGPTNSLLDIIQEDRFGATTYSVLASNLGSLDGTKTQPDSSAILSRCDVKLVYDTAEDFCQRAIDAYESDSIGSLGLTTFLLENKDIFSPIPGKSAVLKNQSKQAKHFTANVPCPRNWDIFLSSMRTLAADHNKQLEAGIEPTPLLPLIVEKAHGTLGGVAADRLATFYSSYFRSCYPASQQLLAGNLTDEARNNFIKDTSADTIAGNATTRGLLDRVALVTANRVFELMNQKDDPNASPEVNADNKKARIQGTAKQFKILSETLFSMGLVASKRNSMIATTVSKFARTVIGLADKAKKNDELNFNFGSIDKATGEPLLNPAMAKGILNQAKKFNAKEHPYGESLNIVGENNNGKITALEDGVTNALTAHAQSKDLQSNLKAAGMN